MREIKFRVWDKQIEHMVIYPTNELLFCEIENKYGYSSAQFDLMQFTGLLDKNGKEIYEGDIVSTWVVTNRDEWEHIENYKVDFRKGCFCLCNERRGYSLSDVCKKEPINKFFQCEVIGNIYEHTELLK